MFNKNHERQLLLQKSSLESTFIFFQIRQILKLVYHIIYGSKNEEN